MLDNYPFEQIKSIIMEASSLHKSRKDLLKKEKELKRTLEDLQEFIQMLQQYWLMMSCLFGLEVEKYLEKYLFNYCLWLLWS